MRNVTIFFLIACFGSFANELLVVTEDRPPYTFISPSGKISGDATQRVRALLTYSDVSYKIKLFPWARAYNTALSQKNVLIYPILKTAQRAKLFHWYCPIMQGFPIYLFKLSQRSDIKVNDLEQAKGFTLGVSRDDWNESFLKQQGFIEGKNLDISADENANLLQLIAGRVDMILVTENSIYERLKKLNFSFSIISKALDNDFKNKTPLCAALSLDSSPEIKLRLENAFNSYNNE